MINPIKDALIIAMKNKDYENLSDEIEHIRKAEWFQPYISLCLNDGKWNGAGENRSLLYLAVKAQDIKAAAILLQQPELDINKVHSKHKIKYYTSSSRGVESTHFAIIDTTESPLYRAVENKNKKMVQLLLNNVSININCGGSYNSKVQTPLQCALKNHDKQIAQLLIDHGAGIPINAIDVEEAVKGGVSFDNRFIPGLRTSLLKRKVTREKTGCNNAITNAQELEDYLATSPQIAYINNLLSAFKFTATMEPENVEAQAMFLKLQNWFALQPPQSLHQSDTRQKLTTQTRLHRAVNRGHIKNVSLLLIYNPASINATDKNLRTPLHIAAQKGENDILLFLISQGGGVNEKDKDGRTPLHLAARSGQFEVVKTLLLKNADIEAIDNEGKTPLHLSCAYGYLEIVQYLLKEKAWLFGKDKNGWTALHWAAAEEKIEVVNFLLEKGANFRATNHDGETPLALAERLKKDFASNAIRKYYTETYAPAYAYARPTYIYHYELIEEIFLHECRELYKQTGTIIKIPEGQQSVILPKPHGSFGEIVLGRDKRNGMFVAIKIIRGKDNINTSSGEAELQKLMEGKEHVMQLFGTQEIVLGEQPILLHAMPYAGFGDGRKLHQKLAYINDPTFLISNPLLKLRILINAAKGLIQGTINMHDCKVVHRDLKPENVLFNHIGHCYVSDFGHAQFKEDFLLEGSAGTIHYRSPESIASSISKQPYDARQADAWAIGLILLEWAGLELPMVSHHAKDMNKSHFDKEIANINELQNPEPGSYFALIKRLLDTDPDTRLTLPEALKFSLFQEDMFKFPTKKSNKTAYRFLNQLLEPQLGQQGISSVKNNTYDGTTDSTKSAASSSSNSSDPKRQSLGLEFAMATSLIGQRTIPEWTLQDVKDDGNCFYLAVVEQLHFINHSFIKDVPQGTEAQDSLRLLLQGKAFNDREWADDIIFKNLAKELDVILAVVDTRNPHAGYTCHYFDEKNEYCVNLDDDTTLPDKLILRIAATGNHFLSVRKHSDLPNGACRVAFDAADLTVSNIHQSASKKSQAALIDAETTRSANEPILPGDDQPSLGLNPQTFFSRNQQNPELKDEGSDDKRDIKLN